MRRAISFSLFFSLLLPTSVDAQATDADIALQFRSEISSLVKRGRSLEDIEAVLMRRFSDLDVDGTPGISATDLEIGRQSVFARLRASTLNRWLALDLDGDFQVSEDELRVEALKSATRPLRRGQTMIEPTPEQVDQIVSDLIAGQLASDSDGDGALSLVEISEDANNTARVQLERHREVAAFPPQADVNNDGITTSEEYRAEIARVFASLEGEAGGGMPPAASAADVTSAALAARRVLERAGLAETGRSFSGARAGCELPSPPEGAQAYFVGAYDGTALTDIHLGDPAQPAELLDITVPAGDAPIYLITTFYGDTILRLRGAAERVRTVVSTTPRIGVIGGEEITFATAPAACHIEVWGGVSPQHPDPRSFFSDRLGTPLAGAVTGETLTQVDLGLGTTRATGRLSGAVQMNSGGDAAEAWRRFQIFNPGGFIPLDPATVRTAGQAVKLNQRPQMAGVAQLVDQGVLVRIPQKNSAATVLEDDAGQIKIGGKTFIPGFGDDAIGMNNLTYIEERPKTWVGRAPEVYLVTRPFTYPAGMSGAHAVVFLLPEGMAEPRGDKGHNRIQRISR
ncbi:MAG: EF-hand domain-containing protein [Pseudomonadota bacterium]